MAIGTIHSQSIQSPSKSIKLSFNLADNGKPNYSVTYKNKAIILQSFLGLKLKTGIEFHKKILKYNGLPFNIEELIQKIGE